MIGPLGSLVRSLPLQAAAPGILDPRWNISYLGGIETMSGQRVSPDTAMRMITVQACVRILSTVIASLPVYIYRSRSDGGKEQDTRHPLFDVLHNRPNDFQTAFEFWEMMITHACYRGRGLAKIVPGRRGAIDQLIPVHPDFVEVEMLENRRLRYKTRFPGQSPEVWTQDEVFDIRLISLDGYTCLSPIRLHREGIGTKAALEQHGATFFANSAKPSGVLTTDRDYNEPADKKQKESWQAAHTGKNAHTIAVLWNNMKFQPIGMTNDEAQFLESNKFQRGEIGNIFGIPLFLLNDMEKGSSFASVEQVNKSLIDFTFRPWVKRIEQAISRDLIVAPQTYHAEFNFDAFLRGSAVERATVQGTLLSNGVITVNEARKEWDKNPIKGGDTPRTQAQNIPLGQTAPVENPPEPTEASGDRPGLEASAFDVRPLLADAARRIMSHERTWAGRRVKYSDNGGREEFMEAFAKWSPKHVEFIVEAVAPVAASRGVDAGKLWPVAQTWVNQTGDAFASAEVVSAVVDCGDREQRLADAMREVFDGDHKR